MRVMKDAEKAAMLKAQHGWALVKEGLMESMAVARKDGDSETLLAASELFGDAVSSHARAGKVVMAIFSDGADIVMNGPGGR